MPEDADLPRGRVVVAGQDPQQGRLARAVRPEQRPVLSRPGPGSSPAPAAAARPAGSPPRSPPPQHGTRLRRLIRELVHRTPSARLSSRRAGGHPTVRHASRNRGRPGSVIEREVARRARACRGRGWMFWRRQPAICPLPQRGPPPPASRPSSRPLSVRLVLPARTLPGGSHLTGRVSSATAPGMPCTDRLRGVFPGRAGQPHVSPGGGLLGLRPAAHDPAGWSSYRVRIVATYGMCTQGPPQDGMKSCLPGGRMPPLPPGVITPSSSSTARWPRRPLLSPCA